MTDAMAELGRAREELRAALRKGIKGTHAEDRIDHLVDEHQAALKRAHAHHLAEQIRTTRLPEVHVDMFDNGTQWAADLIDPEVER